MKLPAALVTLLLAGAAAAQVVQQPAGEPVRTTAGLVAGKRLESGVRGWFGVPFAAPPVRELRWRDPQPVMPWAGVWNADRFAPQCMQPLRASDINHYFGEEPTSENCLYLNIWAPPAPPPAGTPYPVVVWIYGGGFTIGSASMANYAGEALARQGVVYVAIAYRVGPFGFFSHPALSAEAGAPSGNQGLKDQIAALRWVRDNIAGFGGDPANVTIAGQSAGSMSVSLLQLSPAARGLFHRAVGMSGSALGDLFEPVAPATAEAEGLRVQGVMQAAALADMRAMAPDRVLALATRQGSPFVIDGTTVAGRPADVVAAGGLADVPVMLGFTRDESFRSLGPIKSVEDYRSAVRRAFPHTADAVLAAWPATDLGQARRAARDIERDATLGRQMHAWARAQSGPGRAPVFAWLFSRVQPYRPGVTFADHDPATVGAYHTVDVPYWLGTLDSLNRFRITRDWTPADRALSARMTGHLAAFARTGDPGGGWPAFDPEAPRVLQFGDEARVGEWPNSAALPLLAGMTAPEPANRPRPRD